LSRVFGRVRIGAFLLGLVGSHCELCKKGKSQVSMVSLQCELACMRVHVLLNIVESDPNTFSLD